jgi:hypothetical protein
MLLSPRSFRRKVNGSFYPPSSSGVGTLPTRPDKPLPRRTRRSDTPPSAMASCFIAARQVKRCSPFFASERLSSSGRERVPADRRARSVGQSGRKRGKFCASGSCVRGRPIARRGTTPSGEAGGQGATLREDVKRAGCVELASWQIAKNGEELCAAKERRRLGSVWSTSASAASWLFHFGFPSPERLASRAVRTQRAKQPKRR